jgi:YHS domain-containing protein
MSKLILAVMMLVAAGCVENARKAESPAPVGGTATVAAAKPHAECLVCKYENDLACVDIEVEKDTPHATIDGKEYYFCSEACKKQCLKDPKKYLTQK